MLAGRLLGAVEAFVDAAGDVLDPAEQVELISHVDTARAAGHGFDDARSAGRKLTIDAAVRELLNR